MSLRVSWALHLALVPLFPSFSFLSVMRKLLPCYDVLLHSGPRGPQLSSPESLPVVVPAKHAVTSKSSEVHPSPADSVSSCSLLMKGAHHLAAVP